MAHLDSLRPPKFARLQLASPDPPTPTSVATLRRLVPVALFDHVGIRARERNPEARLEAGRVDRLGREREGAAQAGVQEAAGAAVRGQTEAFAREGRVEAAYLLGASSNAMTTFSPSPSNPFSGPPPAAIRTQQNRRGGSTTQLLSLPKNERPPCSPAPKPFGKLGRRRYVAVEPGSEKGVSPFVGDEIDDRDLRCAVGDPEESLSGVADEAAEAADAAERDGVMANDAGAGWTSADMSTRKLGDLGRAGEVGEPP